MAFGDRKGAWAANGASIPATESLASVSGSTTVAFGDLIVVVAGEQTGNTSTAVTDTLGNTYTAVNAGTVGGNVSGRCYYSRVTKPGTNTTISISATSSANNFSSVAASYTGPFAPTVLDAAPSNNANTDNTSPFTCPATGTLTRTIEFIAAWMVAQATQGTVYSATSPNLKDVQDAGVGGLATTILGSQAVTVNSSVSPAFTGTNPTSSVQGTVSFFADTAGVAVQDLPLGHRYPAPVQQLISTSALLSSPLVIPFTKRDWPNPRGYEHPIQLRSWSNGPPLFGYGYFPASVFDWGEAEAIPFQPWQPPYNTALYSPVVAASIPIVNTWSLPGRYPELVRSWTQGVSLAGYGYLPSGATDWGEADAIPFIPWQPPYNTALLSPVVVSKPPGQPDLSLPIILPRQAITWTKGPVLGQRPCNQYDWTNPAPQPRQAILQATSFNIGLNAGKPINQQDWPVPTPRQEPIRSWTQSPNLATPVSYMPGAVYDWGEADSVSFIPWQPQSNAALLSAPNPKPINKTDWPLPGRNPEPVRSWLQTPMFATPAPSQTFLPSGVTDWGEAERVPFDPWQPPYNVALLGTPPFVLRSPLFAHRPPPPPFLAWQPPANFTEKSQNFIAPSIVTDWGEADRILFDPWVTSRNVALLTGVQPRPPIVNDWPLARGHFSDYSISLRTLFGSIPGITYVLRAPTFTPPRPYDQPIFWQPPNNAALLSTIITQPPSPIAWPLSTRQPEQVRSWTQGPPIAAMGQFMPSVVIDWGYHPEAQRGILWNGGPNMALQTTINIRPPITQRPALPIRLSDQPQGYIYVSPFIPPPPPPTPTELPNIEARRIRDWWDRDEWGHFIPGASIR